MSTISTNGMPPVHGNKVDILEPNPDFSLFWTPDLWTERGFRTATGRRLHFRQILPTVAPVGGLKRIHLVGEFDDSILPGPRNWDERVYARYHYGRPPEDLAFHSFVIADDKDNILVALTTTLGDRLPYFETLWVHGRNLISEVTPFEGYWDGALWDAFSIWTAPAPEEPYDASIWLFEQCRTEDELFALEAERVLLEIAG